MAEIQYKVSYDRPGPFGEVRFFDVAVPSGQFTSLDHILQAGWHNVNDLYKIDRPYGAPSGLLLLTVSGEGRVIIGDSKYAAKAGTVTLIPQDVPSAYSCAPGSLWEFYWIHFTGSWSSACVNDVLKHGEHVIPMDDRTIRESMARRAAYTSRGIERELDDAEWLDGLLRSLLRKTASRLLRPYETDQLSDLLTGVDDHLSEPFSLKKLADNYHYSEEHIIRLFKKRVGMSPYQYYVSQKLRHSCRELESGRKWISVIAREHGYRSPGSYSKQFQKQYGMTPTRYREIYGVNQN